MTANCLLVYGGIFGYCRLCSKALQWPQDKNWSSLAAIGGLTRHLHVHSTEHLLHDPTLRIWQGTQGQQHGSVADLRVVHTPHALGMLLKDHGLGVDSCVPHLNDPLIVAADEVVLDVAVPTHAAQLRPAGHSKERSRGLLLDDSNMFEQLQGFSTLAGAAGASPCPSDLQAGSPVVSRPLPLSSQMVHAGERCQALVALHCLPWIISSGRSVLLPRHPVPRHTLLTMGTSRVEMCK